MGLVEGMEDEGEQKDTTRRRCSFGYLETGETRPACTYITRRPCLRETDKQARRIPWRGGAWLRAPRPRGR